MNFNKLVFSIWLIIKNLIYLYSIKRSEDLKPLNFILWDWLKWLAREHEFNHFYYAYGLAKRYKRQKDYFGRRSLLNIIQLAEDVILKGHMGKQYHGHFSYQMITKDKFVAQSCLKAFEIQCIPVIGLVIDGKFITTEGFSDISKFTSLGEFVLKCVSSESSEGVFFCKVSDDSVVLINNIPYRFIEFQQFIERQIFVVQPVIKSHEVIRKINDTALNTTRIVTIRKGLDIIYLGGFQSFATGNSRSDNWSHSAVYVGFNPENNVLLGKGYFHPSIRKPYIIDAHPDSGIRFDGYQIPYLREAVELCIKAHRVFYNHFLLGWDIAITDEGPIVVEVNERPGMNAMQVINGGLKSTIMECYLQTHKYFEKI